MFLFLLFVIFSASGTCHDTAEVCHRQLLIYLWTIDSGISYTWQYWMKNHWPKQTLSQPFSGWMTKPALPVSRLGVPTDPGFKKAWIILYSIIHNIHHRIGKL